MTKIKIVVFTSGIAAVISQSVLIREGLAFFTGNELVTGIILCMWLVWTGLGSIVFSKLRLKMDPVKVLSTLLLIYSFFLICAVIFLRIAPKLYSLPYGEVVILENILLISAIALGPTCLVLGSLFPAAAKILEAQRVYLFEGIGSFIGGILFSFLLAGIVPGIGIVVIITSLLIFASLLLQDRNILTLLSIIPLLLFLKINDIEKYLRQVQMQEKEIIGLRESKYGIIAVTQTGTQVNFYTNGIYDFSYPDAYTAEEAVHYPLLLHHAPQKVLLVGGGMGGCISEIFKHPSIKELVYCELDPLMIQTGEEFTHQDFEKEERLLSIIGDARLYIRNTRKTFDVVIINLPDPVNGQLNRFYTKEFFLSVKKILEPGGILSIRTTAPPDMIGPVFAQFIRTVERTLELSFPAVYILPADKMTYIATDEHIQDEIVHILKMRIEERNLDLLYVNNYFFAYNLTEERISYIESTIAKSREYINEDLKPVCYYYATALWSGLASSASKDIFAWLFNLNPLIYFLLLLPILPFIRRKSIINLAVFATGASEMAGEVLLLIMFQLFYGYVYSWIGLLIAFFMIGLSLGTIASLKFKVLQYQLMHKVMYIQFGLVIYFLLILLASLVSRNLGHIFIPAFLLIGGLFGGLHLPISISILGSEKAGNIYGLDLLGSGLGAIVTAIIFMPLLGVVFTLSFFALLNIVVAIGLRIYLA